jgi:DNA-binding response OmpR family regulator
MSLDSQAVLSEGGFCMFGYRSGTSALGRITDSRSFSREQQMSTGMTGVLLVDDESADIEAMRRALEAARRFDIFTATNYDEGVQVFSEHSDKIALALLDVTLPGRNGVELAKSLLKVKPELRVVFVSGHVGASVIRFYGINAGDEHFLQKPFDGSMLLRRVRRALESQQPLQRTLSTADSSYKEQ